MASTFDDLALEAAGPSNAMDLPDNGRTLPPSDMEVYGADEETLIRLFRTKMKYALAEVGYDQDAQRIVSELVERNVISCGIALSDDQPTAGNLFEIASLQSRLEQLMRGGFQVNSNEPVLLILVDDSHHMSWQTVQMMRDATCTVLRESFYIFPVRVYVARHSDGLSQGVNSRNGFSLALLNVVNTDIGGPGMVQLLDDHTASPDWQEMVVSAEAWNRTDLHWRHEKEIMPASQIDETTEMYEASEPSWTEAEAVKEEATHLPIQFAGPSITDDKSDTNVVEETSRRTSISEAPELPVITEHPALTELRTREATRPPIQHPSWENTRGGNSLLDLIRTQASTVEDSDTETETMGAEVEMDTITYKAAPSVDDNA